MYILLIYICIPIDLNFNRFLNLIHFFLEAYALLKVFYL
jgi:hypothetical protein